MTMWKRREGKLFLAVHACLLLACLLFPFAVQIGERYFSFPFGCFFHDYLFLYCPFCGGTRAVRSLLNLNLLDAVRYNLAVVIFGLFALVLDVIAFVRLRKSKDPILIYPKWGWGALLALFVIFWILRNLLMIFFGIDPTGDLGAVWQNWN